MTSEAGTKQCYALTQSKEKIEETIQLISTLNNTEHISKQLIAIHNQLDGMHELQKRVVKKYFRESCISSKEISFE
tara:strand:- start:692 stop:919 length:228 start_codon:yes stop_codon:yes gene_type:complete